jgi:hypothetical protein
MLFFSSEKYPDEDSYSKYLTEVYMRIQRFSVLTFCTVYTRSLTVVCLGITLIRVALDCSMEAIRMLLLQLSIPIITLMSAQIIWRKPWTGKC